MDWPEAPYASSSCPKSPQVSSPVFESKTDRFVPNRRLMSMDLAQYCVMRENGISREERKRSVHDEGYKKLVRGVVLSSNRSPRQMRILKFRMKSSPSVSPSLVRSKYYRRRHVPKLPHLVLDAPDLTSENMASASKILDWSCHNILAVALGNSVHLWNGASGTTSKLMEIQDGKVCSLSWAPDGRHIAISSQNDEEIQIWNTSPIRKLRRLGGHLSQASCLSWKSSMLSSGGSDCKVISHDVRLSRPIVNEIIAHSRDISCLKWSPSSRQFLASGSVDKLMKIWDMRFVGRFGCVREFEPLKSTVVDLAWCPFQTHVIACAGGLGDESVRFGSIHHDAGGWLGSVQTEIYPANGLHWISETRELLSSHGGELSKSGFCLWTYPDLEQLYHIPSSKAEIIQMAAPSSDDNKAVAVVCSDETVQFWNLFPSPKPKLRYSSFSWNYTR